MKRLIVCLIMGLIVISAIAYAEEGVTVVTIKKQAITKEQALKYQYYYSLVVTEDTCAPSGAYGLIMDVIWAQNKQFIVLATKYINRELMFIPLETVCYIKPIKYLGTGE